MVTPYYQALHTERIFREKKKDKKASAASAAFYHGDEDMYYQGVRGKSDYTEKGFRQGHRDE